MIGAILERNWVGSSDDFIRLSFDERALRRRVLISNCGVRFLVDLPEATTLKHGDAFRLQDERVVLVHEAEERLIEITSGNLARFAWHIGNRHSPCQIEENRLLVQSDHVLADMLRKVGATVREVTEPFRPEGGAYGHGHGNPHAESYRHGK